MMYLQMYNEREFVIAYYEEKDIILGAKISEISHKTAILYVCSRHNTRPVTRLIIRKISR